MKDEEKPIPSASDSSLILHPSSFILHPSSFRYYQLTHDYLVPSLRKWLNRKQKETRRGRAELRLEDRAATWRAKPENRHLPSFWEYATIGLLTDRQKRTEPQQNMLRRAGRVHLRRVATLLVVLLSLGWASYEINGRFQAQALVENLVSAKEDAVLGIVAQLESYRRWAGPLLKSQLATEPQDSEDKLRQLHVRIALLRGDPAQAELLKQALLDPGTPYSYVGVLRDALSPPGEMSVNQALVEQFRADFKDPDREKRFRAGLVLATYDPPPNDRASVTSSSSSWADDDLRFLAEQLVAANPEYQPTLRQYLRPMSAVLLDSLEKLCTDTTRPEADQVGAARALGDFARKDAVLLARMLSVATPAQHKLLYQRLSELGVAAGKPTLLELAVREPADDLLPEQRVALGKERAGAAITLLRRGSREEIFAALRVRDDPESLTQFVHRCREREAQPVELLECLEVADLLRQTMSGDGRQIEDRVLFGLLLALGEFPLEELPADRRQPLIDRLAVWYASDPSSTIHGATGWLLRHWGQEDAARKVDHTPLAYSADRQWYTLEIKGKTMGLPPLGIGVREQTIYMTFVVIPSGEYELGTPGGEPDREVDETRRKVRITYRFAILDREVTWADITLFDSSFASGWMQAIEKQTGTAPTPNQPANVVQWYDSVRFCRWLSAQTGMSEEEQAYANPQTLDKQAHQADPNPNVAGAPLNWPMSLQRRGFRLPTEAEWEVAARSGTRSMYGFGGDVRLLDRYGWFLENSGRQMHEPRQQRPNLRGLFDLHGNVSEWCHDWYGSTVPNDIENPTGAAPAANRVFHGGSWLSTPRTCRSALRNGSTPDSRYDFLGFRVAAVQLSAASPAEPAQP